MMPKSIKNRTSLFSNHRKRSFRASCLSLAVLAATAVLSACGGGSSNSAANSANVSGNWQFTVAPPADGSFLGGLQGGFLLQSGGSVKGAAAYAVSLPQFLIPCSTGTATITGTVTGQNVSFTVVAGTQTFTFTGAVSLDGSTMIGTYGSSAGTAGDGSPCGSAQTGLQWSAVLVAPITGTIQGSFHSTSASSGLINQDFAATGNLVQGANFGASTAPVTGTLSFIFPSSNLSDYPCFSTATVSGQISGNSVALQIVGSNGSVIGQIGGPAASPTGINPVVFDSVQGGYVLQGTGPSYIIATSSCPGNLTSTASAGDYGDLCLALAPVGSANACQQAIALTPASISFPAQAAGMTTAQSITLTNVSSSTLNGLDITLANIPATATDFAETDTCGAGGGPSGGAPFSLSSGQFCAITVSFAPQCASGCTSTRNATLTVTSPVSADNDTAFAVPIAGTVADNGPASPNLSRNAAPGFHIFDSRITSNAANLERRVSSSSEFFQDEETAWRE